MDTGLDTGQALVITTEIAYISLVVDLHCNTIWFRCEKSRLNTVFRVHSAQKRVFFWQSWFQSSAADGAVEMQAEALPPHAGNRRREVKVHVHWKGKFKHWKFLNFLA